VVAAAVVVVTALAWRHRPEDGSSVDPQSLSFRECATEVGITWRMNFLPNEQGQTFKINLYDHGCGLAVGDFDGDGHEDVYFCNQLGPNALYRNNGDGTFTDVAKEAGVALGDRVCTAATFVDFDNDGLLDLFVTSTRGGNVLFRNVGGGKFKDVTKQAGLTHVGHSQTAVFFDFDNDGHLDLLLTNTAGWTSNTYDKTQRYYVGKGEFGSVALSPKEHNVLYRNNGDGTFTDVTLDVLGRTPYGATGAKLIDLDSSGRLSLFVVDMHSDMWMGLDWSHRSLDMAKEFQKKKFAYVAGPLAKDPEVVKSEKALAVKLDFRYEDVLFGNALYRNDGGGKFTEISDRACLETFWPWGIVAGDFDNDGFEDVFLPSGMGYPFYYWPNALMMNNGDGTFRDRAAEMGIESPPRGQFFRELIDGVKAARSSRCAAVADFDSDGRLEIVTNNFNDQPYFFKNQTPRRNYVAFRLRGTRCNRDAIGAVVRVHAGGRIQTRQVQGAGGYLSQSSRVLHFGLGDRTEIDRVEITWPGGHIQRLDKVNVNAVNGVIEPATRK
jgi:hypothetical protein